MDKPHEHRISNPAHIALLLIVVLIVLGPKRLPQAGRSLGRGMREFRDGISADETTPQNSRRH